MIQNASEQAKLLIQTMERRHPQLKHELGNLRVTVVFDLKKRAAELDRMDKEKIEGAILRKIELELATLCETLHNKAMAHYQVKDHGSGVFESMRFLVAKTLMSELRNPPAEEATYIEDRSA